uniref:Uncharacterized protein n=1 Tax=Pseudo-nitzschia multiseries DNA virus TaxID=2364897 RepID=A0A678W2Z7_9VIRU|nr:conserved hypothetical protein [Pseudo-nitzschia multiseries DNA virus]AYD75888.1 conserved hypothetical protein [Pseudo-nitzschia multiseries DNA virus]
MSEQIHIEFTTENAAFDGDPSMEIARILRAMAALIANGMAEDETTLRDINGNRVGFCRITTKQEG